MALPPGQRVLTPAEKKFYAELHPPPSVYGLNPELRSEQALLPEPAASCPILGSSGPWSHHGGCNLCPRPVPSKELKLCLKYLLILAGRLLTLVEPRLLLLRCPRQDSVQVLCMHHCSALLRLARCRDHIRNRHHCSQHLGNTYCHCSRTWLSTMTLLFLLRYTSRCLPSIRTCLPLNLSLHLFSNQSFQRTRIRRCSSDHQRPCYSSPRPSRVRLLADQLRNMTL